MKQNKPIHPDSDPAGTSPAGDGDDDGCHGIQFPLNIERTEYPKGKDISLVAPVIIDDDTPDSDGRELNHLKKDKKKKSKSKKSKKKSKSKKQIFRSEKGIETMFKTSYRAQLDMIAIATKKANIMISINGFFASVLTVSGVFIHAAEHLYVVPSILFLITSAISIFFAIQAASPGLYNKYEKLKGSSSQKKFSRVKASFLNFEYYAELSKKDFVKGMIKTLQNPEKVYLGMIDYLYTLGVIANWKFKMLHYSYFVFRVGMVSGIVTLIIIQAYITLRTKPDEHNMASVTNQLAQFNNIYQPSGVGLLPDNRLLVLERGQRRALRVVALAADGSINKSDLLDASVLNTFNIRLKDLAAWTMDNKGYIYAIALSRQTADGRPGAEKARLVRGRIDNNRIIALKVYDKLGESLQSIWSRKQHFQFSIKGLTFDSTGKRLLIAFRRPISTGKAILLAIENPQAIFEDKAVLKISRKLKVLDLEGAVFSSISYDPNLRGYLIAGDLNSTETTAGHSGLWYWSGNSEDRPRRATLPATINIGNIEGMSPVKVTDDNFLMLVGGDGDRGSNEPAHYLLLRYNQLIIH